MSRDVILQQLKTSLNSFSNFKVSTELPWDSAGTPLYQKNMRCVYVNSEQTVTRPLIETLDLCDVYITDSQITALLTVDAKNPPSDQNAVVVACQAAVFAVAGAINRNTTISTEITDDYITYSFEYNYSKV
jgi:hypothetical protein